MLNFKAAIFDLDGTLIDSMYVWEKIAKDFLNKRHLPIPKSYINKISPMSFPEAAGYTNSLFDLNESVESITQEWHGMAINEYSHHIRLKPFVKEYLLFLKERGIKLGIATASPKALYEPVLRNNGIYELFDAFVSVDEVSRGKEHPDVYLLAAQKLNMPSSDCIVFEDILTGIKGAKAAGMQAYGVYDKYSEHEKTEMEVLADGYIYDFSALYGAG